MPHPSNFPRSNCGKPRKISVTTVGLSPSTVSDTDTPPPPDRPPSQILGRATDHSAPTLSVSSHDTTKIVEKCVMSEGAHSTELENGLRGSVQRVVNAQCVS
jgi:hypothetical protein